MRLINANELEDKDKRGVVVDICDVLEAPTVEAIPVKWIKKWTFENCLDCYDYDYPTEKNDWWYAIEKMLEDWEKENEMR